MTDPVAQTMRFADWQGGPARIDRILPELGLARSRSQAAELIAAGKVQVDGRTVTKASAPVVSGSTVRVLSIDHYVSRAAHKLIAGLDVFEVPVAGRLALDLGASTGGFTQVLLERGARAVIALDVGHAQLVDELREDPRVRVVEGCNARELTAAMLAEVSGVSDSPDLIVADLSFISLSLIFPAIAAVASPDAELVMLIKPQFEVGRHGIRDGLVINPQLAAAAVSAVLQSAAECGYGARGLIPSPLRGGSGNQEFVAYFVAEPAPNPGEWDPHIRAMTKATARPHSPLATAFNSPEETDD